MKLKVAVIGSGMAGLSACRHLLEKAEVDLYEKAPAIGMDAHSIDVDDGGGHSARVDVPLRVIKADYYPTLLELYNQAGIETEHIDYSGSFCDAEGRPYFRYRNFLLNDNSYSYLVNLFSLKKTGRQIISDNFRFQREGPEHVKSRQVAQMTFGEYLDTYQYSRAFSERFILPVFAAINTCTLASVREYPAELIINYITGGRRPNGVRRVVGGINRVAENLSSGARLFLQTPVEAVTADADSVTVRAGGESRSYDYAVFSTQANQAARIASGSLPQHASVLRRFRYEESEVLMHTDTSFLPRSRRAVSPVNFRVDESYDKPMATILMNLIQPDLRRSPVSFMQTWNPHRMPREDSLLSHSVFERPVVTHDSLKAVDELEALNNDPANRVKICGSYVKTGIPLLEAAALSGREVAQAVFNHEPVLSQ